MAVSSSARVAPSLTCWTVLGRWPTPVNICGRVSTSLTGRSTVRAASAVKTTCGQARSPAPNPPPTNGARTRTLPSGTVNAAASAARHIGPLGGVVDGEAAAVPERDRGEQLQRVVGLLRGCVGRLDRDLGGRQPGGHVAAPRIQPPRVAEQLPHGSSRSSTGSADPVHPQADGDLPDRAGRLLHAESPTSGR